MLSHSRLWCVQDQVEFRKKRVPIEGNQIRYSDTLSLPFAPNVSKIGLAPAQGTNRATQSARLVVS
jgi:hypothetical protein